MNIRALSSERGIKHATITLSYEEIRDLSNKLYEVAKNDPKYKDMQKEWHCLHMLVKEGYIERFNWGKENNE